ncbi:hypothetical protein EFK50_20590 [Nocardioides marmoriginsengisoli]|uniref:Uncharacterized protein n=1 Tax=Nocardioides marmoriginsengisoli TaxID=661483 RepID=A0A3N0CCC2_9ACTN|nr:hypothetical protein [Nocardioides marmoriginsengisoli]RNL60706.1 hypothetical protein EFK50_20590 [Nocardioides marmoriginsengisoli]
MTSREGAWEGRRFAAVVLGGVVVSSILVAALLATTTTPGQARAQRAVPVLPPPTTAVAEGSRQGVLAVPEGAIVTDEEGRTWVRVWTARGSRRAEVHQLPSSLSKLIEVTSAGLQAGDVVELVAPNDAEARPRAGARPGGR